MRVIRVSARIFSKEKSELVVCITFVASNWARMIECSLADAANLGKLLLARGFLFIPWTGLTFGWQAFRDEAGAKTRRPQSEAEAYEKLKATI